MKKILAIFVAFIISGCGAAIAPNEPENETPISDTQTPAYSPSEKTTAEKTEPELATELVSETPSEMSEAETTLLHMSLDEKIGQLFFVSVRNSVFSNCLETTEEIAAFINYIKPGGVALFSENIQSAEQTKKLVADLKAMSEIPLFIGIDEEGGRVTRTSALNFPKIPSAAKMEQDKVKDYAETVAEYLSELGINFNFAPVADINTNPQNTVIGDRAFSDDENIAASAVADFVSAMQRAGIHSSVKHFPGHGDTTEDSHYGFAHAEHDLERLLAKELVPFKSGIDAGASSVMISHISVPNVTGDDLPAIFSEFLLKDVLRENLGFEGVIITDALDMGAVTNFLSSGEAAVKCVLAGVDMLLMPENPKEAFDAIKEAVNSGEITVERLDESVLRILKLKYTG